MGHMSDLLELYQRNYFSYKENGKKINKEKSLQELIKYIEAKTQNI